MEFLSIGELRAREGLRLVLVAGAPSPWGQCAKAMMEFKGLEYAAGRQIPGDTNEELVAWAGVNSGPVVAWNDERPLDKWLDILNLLERLAPHRPLLPEAQKERARVVGLSNTICGELGLGWNRRLSMFRPAFESGQPPAGIVSMGQKYGYNESDVALAVERQVAALAVLAAELRNPDGSTREYFTVEGPTALDFYWAGFSVLFDLPDGDRIPMAPDFRPMFELIEPEVKAAIDPVLIAHRDRLLERCFRLPMEF